MMKNIEERQRPNYRLFWVDEQKKKHTVKTFYAEDDAKALEVLKSKKEEGVYDKQLYYSRINVLRIIDNDKRLLEFTCTDDDEFGHKAYQAWKKDNVSWIKRLVEDIAFEASYWILQKPKDIWYAIRDFLYLVKNKEAYSNKWNLDWHMLDSILLNVPSLIENSHGMKFIDDAIVQLYGKDEGFDLKKYHQEHCAGYPKEVEKLEDEIQKREYRKLLLYVKLYRYYCDYGIVDIEDPEQRAFDAEWHHTLPVKEGTYDDFDYEKLNELAKEAWNNIWDWMKKHGDKLND